MITKMNRQKLANQASIIHHSFSFREEALDDSTRARNLNDSRKAIPCKQFSFEQRRRSNYFINYLVERGTKREMAIAAENRNGKIRNERFKTEGREVL